MITLLNMDCLQAMREMRRVRMIFADPPDNIHLGYAAYDDDMPADDYREFLSRVVQGAALKCDVFWMSYNARHTYMVGEIVAKFLRAWSPAWEAKACVQTFTFGQYNKHDLGNNHRPLLRLMRAGTKLRPEAVKVPSWRQLHGDKRAAPGGRVPGDVFDFPRVTGNSRQRRAWHPTQLHEDLYERCIKLCCEPGDTVCDLFAGTGTLARVVDWCEVNALMVEIDLGYCEEIADEHGLTWDGDTARSELI
jgi:site-specific DNA-methyltransferase (adenine-specific)